LLIPIGSWEDGVTRFIECRPDETIADASYRVGINIPLDCVERLEDFAVKSPGFTFFTCVAAEDSAHPRKGYLTAHVESGRLNGGDIDVYV
jgi:hypothetical protein